MKLRKATAAVWRIEYRTDMTRSGSAIIPLAYVVEAEWPQGGARWLGMLFRLTLTKNETAAANLLTWPELRTPKPFLKSLFDEAWASGDSAGTFARFGIQSALNVAPQRPTEALVDLTVGDKDEVFGVLTKHLWTFKPALQPVLAAPVLDLARGKRQTRKPLPVDVEETVEAREAA